MPPRRTRCSCATPHRRQPRRRAGGPGHPTRVVGRADRAGPGARHRPLLRGLRQRARRLPGHHRSGVADPATGRPYGSRFPVVTIRDMVRDAGRARRPPRHRPLADRRRRARWAACRCSSGAIMYPDGCGPSSPSPPARRPPRSRSRGARSGGGRSPSTPAGAAATTTTPRPATVPTRAWPSPGAGPGHVPHRGRVRRPVRPGARRGPARRGSAVAALRRRGLPRLPRRQAVRRFDAAAWWSTGPSISHPRPRRAEPPVAASSALSSGLDSPAGPRPSDDLDPSSPIGTLSGARSEQRALPWTRPMAPGR